MFFESLLKLVFSEAQTMFTLLPYLLHFWVEKLFETDFKPTRESEPLSCQRELNLFALLTVAVTMEEPLTATCRLDDCRQRQACDTY